MSEPEPNLNFENGAPVNPNQTWTAKIFWAGAKPEPEPLFETIRHPAFRSFVAALQGMGMSKILTSWIENLLRHRTIHVELYGDKVKREVVKGNPQCGILSPFLWNCVLNNLLLGLHSRGFYVQAYSDDLAVLVTGADMLWIRGMA